jgi:hypothetical protein
MLIHCEVCDHPFTHMHRLYLGEWGGRYEVGNVAYLCPNHHAAVHLFTKFYYTGAIDGGDEESLFMEYMTDRSLKLFCLQYVKPAVERRLKEEGRRHPYERTLPTASADRARNQVTNRAELRRKRRLKRRKFRGED